MFAESVRMPFNGLQSISGVLPVAMSTIIVSPTARPKPIITAAKIPGLAEGSTTRHSVCQRLAPRAIDAAVMLCGMFESESSASEKMIGMTAKPSPMAMTMLFR